MVGPAVAPDKQDSAGRILPPNRKENLFSEAADEIQNYTLNAKSILFLEFPGIRVPARCS